MTTKTKGLAAPKGAIAYRTFERGALIYQVFQLQDADTAFDEHRDPERNRR